MRKFLLLISALLLTATAGARSLKRGICWDESHQHLVLPMMQKMQPGISWVYNWGPAPKVPAIYGEDSMVFLPMCWNGGFDENAIRTYLAAHPETKYLLGFNEPNFSSQASMGPTDAVEIWPRLEKIAQDFGLKLVAPALNFSGETVAGRVWSPYQWLNAFFRYYPGAKVDCLALHCYMDYASAMNWFATEYFYKDLYDPSKTDAYNKFPYLVKYLDAYREKNGHFPKMMLTEFCAWENDVKNVDFQIDQMTKKVQMLEQSDLVEGYAWFMGNVSGGASVHPYESVFQSNMALSELSELGKVYVCMSDFSTSRTCAPGETVFAKDYVDASLDRDVILRSSSDSGSDAPLQVQVAPFAHMDYLLNVPSAGNYDLTLRVNSTGDGAFTVSVDGGQSAAQTVASTAGTWAVRRCAVSLPAGEHRLVLTNTGSSPLLLSEFRYAASSAIIDVAADGCDLRPVWFNLQGIPVAGDALTPGVYVRVCGNTATKIVIK